MADSNITKKALAASLKDLMNEIPFSKITVTDICNKCEMNRKSFYYHFKDKYDLVNWIYYTEFIGVVQEKQYKTGLDFLYEVCVYLEENKSFYRKVLKIDGQNSFFEYFKELFTPIIEKYINEIFVDTENSKFYTTFFTDAFVNAVKNWMLDSNSMSAQKFIGLIKSCIYGTAKKIIDRYPENTN